MQATIPAGLDRKEAEVYLRLDPGRLPRHIAIIMDGNGRWARRRHLPRIAGHRAGVTSVRSTVETRLAIGIPSLTLVCLFRRELEEASQERSRIF